MKNHNFLIILNQTDHTEKIKEAFRKKTKGNVLIAKNLEESIAIYSAPKNHIHMVVIDTVHKDSLYQSFLTTIIKSGKNHLPKIVITDLTTFASSDELLSSKTPHYYLEPLKGDDLHEALRHIFEFNLAEPIKKSNSLNAKVALKKNILRKKSWCFN